MNLSGAFARVCLLLGLAVAIACGDAPAGGPDDAGTSGDSGTAGASFALDALPTTIQAGEPAAFTLRAVDTAGQTATGYRGTVHFTASQPSTTLSADYSFTAADRGAHAFSFTVTRVGPQSLHATDTVDAAIAGDATVTSVAGPAAAYVISNLGAAAVANVPTAFDVTAVDAYENVVLGYGGSAVVTSSDPAARLQPGPSFTAGVATGVTLTFMTAGAQSVTVIDPLRPTLTATASITVGAAPAGHLYIVAHQDDDLLFANPDIEASIRSGHPTRVIFLTAAGAPNLATWQAREHGVYRPYLMMADATSNPNVDAATYFTCGNVTYNGQAVRQCTLTQNPSVSLVFLRLLDGAVASLWATDAGPPFNVTPVASLTTVDGVNTYTRSSLMATLVAMFADFAPARVGTLDSTLAYGFDHTDHVASALFALEAMHTWGTFVDVRIHRGYTMDGAPDYYAIPAAEAVNLSVAEYDRKYAVMLAYGGPFASGGTFDNWCHRHYSISRLSGGRGPLADAAGCIDTQGGQTANGTRAVVTACNDQTAQRWTARSDYQLAGPAGKCLTIGAANVVQIDACAATAAQKWTVFANGQVRGQNGLCLTDAAGLLSAEVCRAETASNQRLPATSQRFTQRASAPFAWSAGSNFSDADLGGASSSFRSLGALDLDGDGYSDACVRLAGGLYCGINGHVLLGAHTLFSASFSNANGWAEDAYGGTVQYADVNGDQRPDACARTSTGIVCALGTKNGFAPETSWSTEFSDATVFAGPLSYRSIHFADVNGDGFADVCGRTAAGISCARNTQSGAFAPSTAWITSSFTDAGGWNADAYASTVQLADVNGDGKADVCGRGPTGVVCAVSDGVGAFVHDRTWSFRGDFGDAAGWSVAAGYYGSIHFGDINGDGLADVCGRNASGLTCALSDAFAFQQGMPLQPGAFTNAQGWLPEVYGTSLRIADMNHDGRADACGRSSAGLFCTTAP